MKIKITHSVTNRSWSKREENEGQLLSCFNAKKRPKYNGGGNLYIHCLNMSLPIFVQVAVFLLLNY